MPVEPSAGQIGPKLKALRAGRGLSQQELADRAGLSRATVSNAENNIGVPGFDAVIKLAQGLNVSAAVFLPATPEGVPQAGWEVVARRLRLTYEETMRLRDLLAGRGVAETASAEQALLAWMREIRVLP